MSDTMTTETTVTDATATVTETPAVKAPRAPRKASSSIKLSTVLAMAEELGLSQLLKNGVEHKSSVQYGQMGGVRVAVARNEDVGRVFLCGQQPEGAFIHYTDDERKDKGLGHVCAEVDFKQGAEAALEAVRIALTNVKNAPPVAAKVVAKPKKVKEPKVETAPAAPTNVEVPAEASV